MKKVGIAILSILIFLFIAIKGFTFFSSKGVLRNEAVFELYMTISDTDIDRLFNLEHGTYNVDEYQLICKLPIEVDGFKSGYRLLENKNGAINCKEVYNKKKHIKYKSYELKDGGSKLLLLKRTKRSIDFFSERLGSNLIVAARPIYFTYKKGEINHILLTKHGIQSYCE